MNTWLGAWRRGGGTGVFQSLEKTTSRFPIIGKKKGRFSKHWKIAAAAILALGALAAPLQATPPVIAQYMGIFDFQDTSSPTWNWLMTNAPFGELNRLYIAFAMLQNGALSYNIGTNAPDSAATTNEMRKIDALVAACRAVNPHAAILISSGYDNGAMYQQAATNPARFAQSVLAFVQRHQLDGYDMDWENGINGAELNTLLQATRAVLQTNINPNRIDGKYFLTLATWPLPTHGYTDIPTMAGCIDQINIMSYGTADSGVDDAKEWQAAGVGWNQIVIGIETECSYKGAGVDTLGPEGTIAAKCRYARTNELAGVMAWRMDNDYKANAGVEAPPDARPTFRGAHALYAEMTDQGPLVHYVDAAGASPVAPYTNWLTAATNIQDALDAATNEALVWVTNGTYAAGGTDRARVDMVRPLTLRSVNGPAHTTIDGDATVRGVYLPDFALLSGFTVTGGDAGTNSGGGVRCAARGVVVHNCEIAGNIAANGGGAAGGELRECLLASNFASFNGGGGFAATLLDCTLVGNAAEFGDGGGAASSILTNCTLVGNNAINNYGGGAHGGALYNCTLTGNAAGFGDDGGGGGANAALLARCVVSGNMAASDGGGARACTLLNTTLSDNTAGYRGGGAHGGTLTTCLLTGNRADYYGGGAYGSDLMNCTLAGNSSGYCGGAAYCTVLNSLVYYNTADYTGPRAGDNYYESTFDYSCTVPAPTNGTGNTGHVPLIASANNPRLLPGSPCYNTGTNQPWMTDAADIDGDERIYEEIVDMGAYEYAGMESLTGALTAGITASVTNLAVGYYSLCAAQVTGKAAGQVWDFGDGILTSNRCQVWHAWRAPGTYAVTLTVTNLDGQVTATARVVVAAEAYYVAPGGHDTNNGLTWATAKQTIQAAADAATGAGATIWVTNGVYATGGRAENRVELDRPANLRSVNGAARTVIDGGGLVRGVYLVNDALLEGFTIANGLATNFGGGVRCDQGRAWISDCRFTNNTADCGGGASGDLTLLRCDFLDNAAATDGGGVYDGMSAINLHQGRLLDNTAGRMGGGANGAWLYSCLLAGNSAESGGGVYWGTLNNCTVYGNAATNVGGGVCDVSLCNSIAWGNSAGAQGDNWWGVWLPATDITFTCTTPRPPGAGNLTNDPAFRQAGTNDLRLAAASPCINAGTNYEWAAGLSDLAGNARIIGPAVDMGAYEYPLAPSSLVAATNGSGCLQLTWAGVNGAGGFAIFRSTTTNVPGTALAVVSGNSYCDASAKPGQRYYYWINAHYATEASALSARAIGWLRNQALPWLMLLL